MVFSLLGTEVAPERRSQTLNLVYLPLYLGGIVGPVLASQVVALGVGAPFVLATVVFVGGALAIALLSGRDSGAARSGPDERSSTAEFETEALVETQIG